MTIILSNMEKKDLIFKETAHVSGGKRAFAIFLTDRGRKMVDSVNKIVSDVEDKAFAGFTELEREQLVSYLDRLGHNLSEINEAD